VGGESSWCWLTVCVSVCVCLCMCMCMYVCVCMSVSVCVIDLVWSDPEEVDTWAVSPRGAGWLFGSKVTNEVSR